VPPPPAMITAFNMLRFLYGRQGDKVTV
jgi:hypothetical protein